MDKKQVVLSTAAGLALIVVSYLVWRHEELVSAANAQANLDAQQAQSDAQQAQLASEIAALPTSGSYGGASYAPNYGNGASGSSVPDTGSTSLQTPAGASSDLQAILAAFFPPQPATTTPTTPTADTGTQTSVDTSGAILTASQTPNPTLPTSNTGAVSSPVNIYPVSLGVVGPNGVGMSIQRYLQGIGGSLFSPPAATVANPITTTGA